MNENTSDSWFQISNAGWKRMNAGRSLGHLVREAISNVFDADGVTFCKIQVNNGSITVEDDAPNGIADKSLVTTVFMTDKEDSYVKRGRKGRGLKELIAAGDSATVKTVGYSVAFNPDGSRHENASGARERGTEVVVRNAEWEGDVISECCDYLERFMPPATIRMTVNGRVVNPAKVRQTGENIWLSTTVIKDGKQVEQSHPTTVLIRNLRKGEREGWIYEMGIPVQKSETKFDIDVQQRIPMNDNRDVVDTSYLQHLYGAVLNLMVTTLSKTTLKDKWVLTGIMYAESDTQKLYARAIVPKGSVIKSKDRHANDKVKQQGLDVVDISNLPYEARAVLGWHINDADAAAKALDESAPVTAHDEKRDLYPTTVKVLEWLCYALTSRQYRITFMSKPKSYTGSQTQADHNAHDCTIRFNTECDLPLDQPLNATMLAILVHELGHRASSEHDDVFMNKVEQFAGELAVLMLTRHAEVAGLFEGGQVKATSKATGKLTRVDCQWPGCTEHRMVKAQDLHQVRFCLTHKKENDKAKAKARRLAKGE